MSILMFPGQGSQFVGMGQELFDQFPEQTKLASEVLGYDIQALCIEDQHQQLNQTNFTQPAIFVVSMLAYYAHAQAYADQPVHAYLGHSLGEYSALCAAGCIEFSEALSLVQARGEICHAMSKGAMAAVIGLDIEAIETLLEEHNVTQVYVANHNANIQIVLAGAREALEQFGEQVKAAGARRFVMLPVSAAFHTPLMTEAMQGFTQKLAAVNWQATHSVKVIANLTAKPYVADEIVHNLSQHLCQRVRWLESINQLLQAHQADSFVEVGPGRVLAGLLSKIKLGK